MHCPNCLSSLSLRKQFVQRRKAHFTLNVVAHTSQINESDHLVAH